MKRESSGAVFLPSVRNGTATMSTAYNTGSDWNVTVGALACTEIQIAQGRELEMAASEWAWVASNPAITRAIKMQLSAIKRFSWPVSNWPARITLHSTGKAPDYNIAFGHRQGDLFHLP